LTLFLVIALPYFLWELFPEGVPSDLSTQLTLLTYWIPANYNCVGFHGIGGFALSNFLVCLIAAATPLLAALWLFNRKAY
jgi:hypothetical protein